MQKNSQQNRRVFERWTVAVSIVVLVLTLMASAIAAAPESRLIKVGLFYGSKALPTANLANEVGVGYRFGSFDGKGAFTQLGFTQTEKITVCKDTNLYLSGGSFYETPTASASTLIGAYHLQAQGAYASYDEALTAAAGYPHGFPAYVDGKHVVRFEFYSAAANAASDQAAYPGSTVVGGSASCYTVVETSTGKILYEYDAGGSAYLGIMPARDTGVLAQTWFKGYQYYGGFQYMRRSGNDISVINIVDEDRYVVGVLPYEFVSSGALESLKAGAVAVRTFSRITNKHGSLGFTICNTTCCQVYRGVYTAANADNIIKASEQTKGECAYSGGVLIQALYSSSDGGATEDAVNAWGGEYAYLKGKADPYEKTITFGGQNWSYQVTPAQIQALLTSQGHASGTIVKMEVTQKTTMGNVNEMVITDNKGETFTYKRDNVRILQNIPGVQYMSRRFTITPNDGSGSTGGQESGDTFSVYDGKTTTQTGTVTAITGTGKISVSAPATVLTEGGTQSVEGGGQADTTPAGNATGWTLTGSGYGHNIGMSQWGAYAMGKQGFTYDEILKFYYTGIEIK